MSRWSKGSVQQSYCVVTVSILFYSWKQKPNVAFYYLSNSSVRSLIANETMAYKQRVFSENYITWCWHININDNNNYNLHIVSTSLQKPKNIWNYKTKKFPYWGLVKFWNCGVRNPFRKDSNILKLLCLIAI